MGNYIWRGGALLFLAASTMLIVSCGAGGGGHHGGGGGGGNGELGGELLDALTQGVNFSSSGPGTTTVTGTTDVNGTFDYYAGQTTTFTLSAGTGGSITLGSVQPAANGGGSTIVFVGGMNNALEVAQVLQSLNYSGSASQINVSNLTLTAADVTNLQDYITSGGTSFGSAASYSAMMTQAQTDAQNATPGLTFVYPGGATAAQASANLATAAGTLPAPGSLNNVPGLYYFAEIFTNATVNPPVSSDGAGMIQIVAGNSGNSSGTYTDVLGAATAGTASTSFSGTYSVSGNVLTNTHQNQASQTVVDTITVDYKNPTGILFTSIQTVNGTESETATGNAYALSSIATADLANRTITFAGFAGGACAAVGASPVAVFSGNGQSYSRYCSNDMTTVTGTGTVAAASGLSSAEPIPLQVTDTPTGAAAANEILMALVTGSIAQGSSGTIALLTTLKQTTSGGVYGVFSFTAQ